MGCCGQARSSPRCEYGRPRENRQLAGGTARAVVRDAAGRQRSAGGVSGSLPRNAGVRVRGAVSGRAYEFSRGTTMTVVSGDVPDMVRTGLFVRR